MIDSTIKLNALAPNSKFTLIKGHTIIKIELSKKHSIKEYIIIINRFVI